MGDAKPHPLGLGVVDPLKTCFSPRVMPYLVVVGQTVQAYILSSAAKNSIAPCVPPFKVTRGH